MTWLVFWFGMAVGTALGILLSIGMHLVTCRPRRIKVPRALVIDDGSARWPWIRR